jgi:hypothetical protein
MGTPAMIGIWNETTGEVSASYVHYDGYVVGGVGELLVASYNDVARATLVATGGYLSSLEEDYAVSRAAAAHSDKTVAFASVEDFLAEGFDYAGAEYIYLWDGEAWFVAMNTLGGEKTLFEEVEMQLSA